MQDDGHGTEMDPIVISTQGKDCRLVYNLRKRRDRKTSTYLRTPYTNPLKKARQTIDVEVHLQKTVEFQVRPLVPQEELLELQRWMDIANDNKEPEFINLTIMEVNGDFFWKLYTPDTWLSNVHINIACYYLRKDMSKATAPKRQPCAIMDNNFLYNLKERHKVYIQDPDRVWEKDSYCIDYANGEKLDCATPWKNVLTVYLPIFVNEHWILGVVDIHAGKISIYDCMIDYTKDSALVKQLLPVADMIPLLLQKISYHESHPDCAEVISKNPWPILRERNISQQKSGGDCGAFLLRYLEVLANGLDVNTYCQQDDVTQFCKSLAFKLFGHRSWKPITKTQP